VRSGTHGARTSPRSGRESKHWIVKPTTPTQHTNARCRIDRYAHRAASLTTARGKKSCNRRSQGGFCTSSHSTAQGNRFVRHHRPSLYERASWHGARCVEAAPHLTIHRVPVTSTCRKRSLRTLRTCLPPNPVYTTLSPQHQHLSPPHEVAHRPPSPANERIATTK
jgi:hypothetical protein